MLAMEYGKQGQGHADLFYLLVAAKYDRDSDLAVAALSAGIKK